LTDKQFDVLAGISRSMEKSLKAIEDGLEAKSNGSGASDKKTAKASAVLGGIGTSLDTLLASIAISSFDSSKGDEVISFSQKLVDVANQVTSTAAKDFGEFAEGIGKAFEVLLGIMTVGKIIKLKLAAKILFEGKKPLLTRIITGLQDSFKDIDGKNASKGAKALKDIATGLATLSKALGSLILLALAAPFVIVGALVARAVVGLFVSIGNKAKEIGEGGKAMNLIGKGLMFLAGGIATMALVVAVAGPKLILESIVVIGAFALVFALLGQADRSIRQGARALALVGLALFGFAAGLATYMLALLIATPKLVLEGILIIGMFAIAFALMGLADKYIAKGALAMLAVGIGLFFFSGGLMIFALALELFSMEKALLGGLLIAEIGFAMYLVGKFGKQISQGALAMAEIGVGLGLFSVGLLIFGIAIKLFDLESVVLGAVIIAGIGTAVGIVGALSASVLPGAAALSAMGMGLLLFSAGILVFGLAIKILRAVFDDLKEAGVVAGGLILGFGLAMGILGLQAPLIIAGAGTLSAMGMGLLLFSAGILIFSLAIKAIQNIFGEDLGKAGVIAGSIIMGLGLAIGALGVISPLIVFGAVALTTMGVSLAIFSVGLMLFSQAVKIWEKATGGLDNSGKFIKGIFLPLGLAFAAIGFVAPLIVYGAAALTTMGVSLTIFSVGLAVFAGALNIYGKAFGGLEKSGEGVKNIFLPLGVAFTALGLAIVPIALGSVAAVLLASSLIAVGAGLFAFSLVAKYISDNKLITDTPDGKMLKGIDTLPGIAKAISRVGLYALKPSFWLGVSTSMGIGASLASIGAGLSVAAKSLNEVKNMDKLIANLFGESGLIPSIAKSFGEIGKTYGGSVLSSFFGTDKVSVGIRVTRGFGDVLQELAGGIVAFANFSEFPVKVPDPKDPSRLIYQTVDILGDIVPAIATNIPTLLTSLADVFAEIGNKYPGKKGFFGGEGDSPVQKGIGAVKGLGAVLQELAGGIVAFANFEEFPLQVPDPKDPSKLIYKSVNLFDTLPKIKEVLVGDGTIAGKLSGKSGILFGLAEIFAEIGNKYPGEKGFLGIGGSEGPVKKGVDAVKGIGGVVSELAEGIIAFANMGRGLPNYDKDGKFNGTYTKFSLDDVQKNITKVLTALPNVFASIDIGKMEEAKEKAESAIPLAKAVSQIGEAIKKLMVDKDPDKKEQTNLIDVIGPSLKKFSDDIKDFEIDDKKIEVLQSLSKIFDRFGYGADKLGKFAESLTATGAAFSKFSQGFGMFSSQLESFMKFENSFSNLVKNQHSYKFGKFAGDMGVLKENVNAFNVENLKLTDSLMKSMAVLSKSDRNLGPTIKQALDEAMKNLIEAIEKLSQTASSAPSPSPLPSPPPASVPVPKPAPGPKIPPSPPLTQSDIQSAFYQALVAYKAAKNP